MSALRERVNTLLEEVTDEQMEQIVVFLERIIRKANEDTEERRRRSRQAYLDLQQYRRPSTVDRDWKKEIADAIAEKYESLG